MENLFLAAMSIGLSMFAAQYMGKEDYLAAERVFAYVMKAAVTISVVFFLAGLCIPEILMRIFTDEQALIDGGAVYLRIVSVSFLLTGISQICLCMLKNSGRAAKAGIISSVSVIINIVLNAVFIFGLFGVPEMGIAGAALATVTAKLTETAWCMLEIEKKGRIRLRLGSSRKDGYTFRQDFWKYTAPVLGNEIVWGVGFTMYSVVMGHLGSDAVAANSVAGIVKNLTACFCLGLASGSGIMVGNELGTGKPDMAREYGGKLTRLSVVCGVVSGLVLLMLSPLILFAADLSAQAEGYLKWMLVMCSCYMTGKSVNSTTISGIFCAGGDSRFGFFCDAVTMWCITVPAGCMAAFVLGLPVPVVYFIVNLDEMIKLPAVYRHYKKYKWVKDLTVKENENEYNEKKAVGNACSKAANIHRG